MIKNNILIVEDDVIIARCIQMLMMNLGYNVIGIESTGEGAIKIARENKPDLVLMDIKLEGYLDGIQTAKQIIKFYDVKIIFISGYLSKKFREEITDIKSFGFVSKPVNEDEISLAIEMAFSKKYL